MNKHGKSDSRVVLTTLPNKVRRDRAPASNRPSAEVVEGRRLAKGNSFQRTMFRTQRRVRMSPEMERIRRAAKRHKGMQFTALLHHVYDLKTLREAYFRLKRTAAQGVDGVTWQHYGGNLEVNLKDLSDRLKRGAYRAKPTRRRYIPKADGGQRPLGVTSLEDKVVQSALVTVLNAIYEVDFLGFSYGFRPCRNPHDALDAVAVGISQSKVNWVLDADIRGYFDAMSHSWLMKFLGHRIADPRILRLIQKWLKAGVLEDGELIQSEVGSPQGASVSPLLANIYLHYVFDLWAHQWRQKTAQGDVRIIRYADDFVVGFQHKHEAERFLAELRKRFLKFGLELHPKKTRLIQFGRYASERRQERGLGKPETFDFLGFTHICGKSRKGKFRVERRTIAKRMRAKSAEVKIELRRRRHHSVPQQGAWLRQVLLGHYRYFGVPLNGKALQRFQKLVVQLWQRSLSRRSHKGHVKWDRMNRYCKKWIPVARIYHPYPEERFGVYTQGRSPVRQFRTLGSERGAAGNGRPYRDQNRAVP